jgi:hypothetical protein
MWTHNTYPIGVYADPEHATVALYRGRILPCLQPGFRANIVDEDGELKIILSDGFTVWSWGEGPDWPLEAILAIIVLVAG